MGGFGLFRMRFAWLRTAGHNYRAYATITFGVYFTRAQANVNPSEFHSNEAPSNGHSDGFC